MFRIVVLLLAGQTWAELSDKLMHPSFPPSSAPLANSEETTSSYWIENAQKTVGEIISRQTNQNIAKNVILFLGDGMSVPTLAASRAYNGGEETHLAFDKFPHTALSKTYAVDRQVPDSANTATAYLCGVKANYGTIGVGPEITRDDCAAMNSSTHYAHSIAYHSQNANKKTGLVTTARVTHASPGGVYAHTANRDWECDADIVEAGFDPELCMDIGRQLIYGDTGRNLNVVMGGGRNRLLPEEIEDPEGHKGHRLDGVNLIDEWLAQRDNAEYIWNRNQLLSLAPLDNVIGLFGHSHLDFNVDRDTIMDPSLAEMTEAAIKVLSRGENGFFLFVEGARIDMAHHDTQAGVALNETIEFSKAVQTAIDLTDESETLIIVTSDHAHTMSYSGYALRGHNVLEFAGEGTDGMVYTTLNYANGPGYQNGEKDGSRHDPSDDDYQDIHYAYPAIAPLDSETHGGDDVAVFAKGPWAHLFSGVLEENVLPHLMAYASCVGDGLKACDQK